jgi:hypothetical protein
MSFIPDDVIKLVLFYTMNKTTAARIGRLSKSLHTRYTSEHFWQDKLASEGYANMLCQDISANWSKFYEIMVKSRFIAQGIIHINKINDEHGEINCDICKVGYSARYLLPRLFGNTDTKIYYMHYHLLDKNDKKYALKFNKADGGGIQVNIDEDKVILILSSIIFRHEIGIDFLNIVDKYGFKLTPVDAESRYNAMWKMYELLWTHA